MTNAPRFRELDGLRGLAALGVVVFHYLWQSANLYPQIGSPIGPAYVAGQGVDLFFVISGFVIMMTLERSTLRGFLASRVSRLYPVYWAAVVLTFAVVTIVRLPGHVLSVRDGLVNLTMLQSYVGVPHVDGAYWTLAVELAFYAQCAVLWYSGLLSGRRLPWTLAAWLGLATGASIGLRLAPHLLIDTAAFQALQFIPLFIAGIAVLHLHRGGGLPMVGILVACGGAVALLSVWFNGPPYAIVYALLLLLVLRWRPLGTTSRVLVFLGEISYALYLIHEFIGYSIILQLMGQGVPRMVATAVAAGTAFALAIALTYLVDKPLRRPLRTLIAGTGRARPAGALPGGVPVSGGLQGGLG